MFFGERIRCAARVKNLSQKKDLASPSGDAESRMDDEVGDNDEEMNALLDDLDGAFAWTDSFCADAISSDFVKGASPCGLICESSEITSATTSGKVADFGIRDRSMALGRCKKDFLFV